MQKILVFGYTMDMGGAEKVLVDTLKYLDGKADIDLYLLDKKGILLSEIPKRVKVYQIKKNLVWYIFFRFIPGFRKLVINQIANQKEYDVALGYMEGRCATWVADIKKPLKKYVWIHNDVNKFDIGISYNEIISSYNKVDQIITVSNDAKTAFMDKYHISSDKITVIYNYIDTKAIITKAKAFKVTNPVFTFVNVAKMRDQKRQDRLVKAAIALKAKGYQFQIQLIGDGPNLDKIKELVKTNDVSDVIEILGLQSNPYPYIANGDCFVLCSDMEGYSIVTKEALILHKLILTTDVTGPREILENGKYGLIIKNNDDALIEAMTDILKNKHKYQALIKRTESYQGDNELIQKQTLKLLGITL